MSLYRLFGTHGHILYFDVPISSPKISCLYLYMTFKSILVCICNFWPQTRVHQDVSIKENILEFSSYEFEYIDSWPSIFLENARTRPSITSLEYYILSLFNTLKEEKLKSKETIVHCCLIFLILESTSLCPFGSHSVLPKISFAFWSFYRDMEDWSGGGIGGGLSFSDSRKCQ